MANNDNDNVVCFFIIIITLTLTLTPPIFQEVEVVEVIDAEVEGTEIQNDTLERIAGTQHGND